MRPGSCVGNRDPRRDVWQASRPGKTIRHRLRIRSDWIRRVGGAPFVPSGLQIVVKWIDPRPCDVRIRPKILPHGERWVWISALEPTVVEKVRERIDPACFDVAVRSAVKIGIEFAFDDTPLPDELGFGQGEPKVTQLSTKTKKSAGKFKNDRDDSSKVGSSSFFDSGFEYQFVLLKVASSLLRALQPRR